MAALLKDAEVGHDPERRPTPVGCQQEGSKEVDNVAEGEV